MRKARKRRRGREASVSHRCGTCFGSPEDTRFTHPAHNHLTIFSSLVDLSHISRGSDESLSTERQKDKGYVAPVEALKVLVAILLLSLALHFVKDGLRAKAPPAENGRMPKKSLFTRPKRGLLSFPGNPNQEDGHLLLKKPRDWKTMGYHDYYHYFDCFPLRDYTNKPVPTVEDYEFLRQKYIQIVDSNWRFDDPVPPTMGYSIEKGKPFPPPFYAKLSPGKGRGLFASRDIEEGELVHRGGLQNDVTFPSDGLAWKEYIFSLPKNYACSVMDWQWTQWTNDDAGIKLFLGLDISSLMNGSARRGKLEGTPNVLPKRKTSMNYYALRDIGKDEEILTDYDFFETKWRDVGLGVPHKPTDKRTDDEWRS